jgi:cell division transport system permease protein
VARIGQAYAVKTLISFVFSAFSACLPAGRRLCGENKKMYALKEGIRSLGRDRIQSLIAIGVTTFSIFILGIFLLVTRNLQMIVEVAREKVEITAYLEDDITKAELGSLQKKIKGLLGVKTVSYISKEEAMKILRQELGEDSVLLDDIKTNPLPASLQINLHSSHKGSEEVSDLAETIQVFNGIEDVQFGGELVGMLDRWIQVFLIIDIALGLLIGGASLFVIFNTILLTVFSKREEIEIMSLVGATEGFIRRPFLFAGTLSGLIGGTLASLLIFGVTYLGSTQFPNIVHLEWTYYLGIAGFGLLIGLWGSNLSLRRFVRIRPG